jgi:hypothetical protein
MTDDDKALVAQIRKEASIQIGFDGFAYQTLTRWADRIEALSAENEKLLNLLRDCDPERMSWLDARDAALGETT